MSLPSRERGLKYVAILDQYVLVHVAPLAGAWIEIIIRQESEMAALSLPSRERGLKCSLSQKNISVGPVAPLAGAWIEIL